MAQGLEFDLKDFVLSNTSFGPQEVRRIVDAISDDSSHYKTLRDAVQQFEQRDEVTPAGKVRLGICQYLLGRYLQAIETLKNSDSGALAYFYLGKSHFASQQYDEAIKAYRSAAQAGYDRDVCAVAEAEAMRYKGEAQAALALLDNLSGAIEQTAEYLFQRGATVASLGGNPDEVVRLYERAVAADGNHCGALFGLALENDRHGNDGEAVRLYEASTKRFPTHVGALLNLGVLYEDRNEFEKARLCYRRILDVFPDHDRATMYYKDVEASRNMFIDPGAQRQMERLNQQLNIPVTDFELSVRSRNCLQRMGVRTLGDLTRTTEQELLSSKNFGETSLVEIREMLGSKGLELGQFAHEAKTPEPADFSNLSADEQALLGKPVNDLNLSVRARKCMVRLGIGTIGELVRRTGDELLECKNFGVTSLNEVREKLTIQGLKLRGE